MHCVENLENREVKKKKITHSPSFQKVLIFECIVFSSDLFSMDLFI